MGIYHTSHAAWGWEVTPSTDEPYEELEALCEGIPGMGYTTGGGYDWDAADCVYIITVGPTKGAEGYETADLTNFPKPTLDQEVRVREALAQRGAGVNGAPMKLLMTASSG